MNRPAEPSTVGEPQAGEPLRPTRSFSPVPGGADGPALAIGTWLGGKLRIDRLLDAGGMGEVYVAWHKPLDREVAVKVLPRRTAHDADALTRFRVAIQTQARTGHHPHIAALMDAGEENGQAYLVMEYVPGLDLRKQVAAKGPLPWREACQYIRQAALGLDHAHRQGIIHRDIKPSNLLLTPEGQIKILDWGLSRRQDQDTFTQSGAMLGTPAFMSPEQALDPSHVDHRSDLYSLGCTLYYLLAGRIHLADEAPPDVCAACPGMASGLAQLIGRMLAKSRTDRPQSAQDVATALAALASDSSPDGEPGDPTRTHASVKPTGRGLELKAEAAVPWLRFRTLKVGCAVTIASLGFVVVSGLLIHHAMTGAPLNQAPQSEARVRASIEKGEHAQAAAELKMLAESGGLAVEKIEELTEENRAAWFARARAEFNAGHHEDADKIATELLADAPRHAKATALRGSVEQQRALARYRQEADKALAAKDYPKARELADKSDAIPGGLAIASAIRARIPATSVIISPAEVAQLATQLRKQPAGKEAQDLAAKILAAQKDHKEAAAHERTLRHLDELRAAQPPSGVTLAGSLRELAGFPESLPRAEELCAAVADLADKNPAWVKEAGTALGTEAKLPPEMRGYALYVSALGELANKQGTKAADLLLEVQKQDEQHAHVLRDPQRRGKAAAILILTAEEERVPGTLDAPFKEGADGAERTYRSLQGACALRGVMPAASPPSLRLDLALAAAHRKDPDKVLALGLLAGLEGQKTDKAVAGLLEKDALAIRLAHARCQNVSDLQGLAAALKDYADVASRLAESPDSGGFSPSAIYGSVLRPAEKVAGSPLSASLPPADKQTAARLHVEYARHLKKHPQQRWDDIPAAKVPEQIVHAYDAALSLHRTADVLAERVETRLDLEHNQRDQDLQLDTKELVERDPKSPRYQILRARVMLHPAKEETNTDKRTEAVLAFLDACREAKTLLDAAAKPLPEKGKVEELLKEAKEPVRWLTREGIRAAHQKKGQLALQWADKLRFLDPAAAARIQAAAHFHAEQYEAAKQVYQENLKHAVEPGEHSHVFLRLDYVLFLISDAWKKVREKDPKKHALEALQVVKEADEALRLAKHPSLDQQDQGFAYGMAAMARNVGITLPDGKAHEGPWRKELVPLLETALKKAPNHEHAVFWHQLHKFHTSQLERSPKPKPDDK